MKTAKMKTEMKMGKTDCWMYHTEGRKKMGGNWGEAAAAFGRQIDGEKWLLDDSQEVWAHKEGGGDILPL
jgi:hypothetical protein